MEVNELWLDDTFEVKTDIILALSFFHLQLSIILEKLKKNHGVTSKSRQKVIFNNIGITRRVTRFPLGLLPKIQLQQIVFYFRYKVSAFVTQTAFKKGSPDDDCRVVLLI